MSRPQAGRCRARGGRGGAGHAAGEAGAGLPAVRPQPRAPAAGVNNKDSDDLLRRKQTETLFIFLRKTDVRESQVRRSYN